MTERDFHPVANIFPLLTGEAFYALADDIAANGLREPIILHPDGRIIDGRNRYSACIHAGVEPTYRTWDGAGSLVAFVVSLNLHRRHLDESGRALVAAKIATLERGSNQHASIDAPSQPAAAEMLNVSRASVQRAREVLDRGVPELVKAVESGVVTVSDAARVVDLAPDAQRDALRRVVEGENDERARTLRHAVSLQVREEREKTAQASTGDAPQLIAGDWRAIFGALDDEPVDLLLTDPPYMTDIAEPIEDFARGWLAPVLDLVSDHGRAYICTGAYPQELAAYTAHLLEWCQVSGWTYANVLVWTYRNTLGPSPARDYKANWQAIHYLRGPTAPPLDCAVMTEQFSVQDINAPDGRVGDRYHAWQKPEALAERLISHASTKGQLVIDPFAGTGTFLVCAARLGRRALGCEPDDEMRDMAVRRGCRLAE